uniref:Uncharacterized protein n=1 Tax=Anguilla anguilla TaxID=7936 RepID=A0A0E9U0M9_ANGAN
MGLGWLRCVCRCQLDTSPSYVQLLLEYEVLVFERPPQCVEI